MENIKKIVYFSFLLRINSAYPKHKHTDRLLKAVGVRFMLCAY